MLVFPMNLTPDGRAFGYCSTAQGLASLTYGYGETEAQPLLLVPATIPIPPKDPNELKRTDTASI